MGNRANIVTRKKDIGIYVHWYGGLDSINAFLTYCKLKEYSTPENDCYGWARLCQTIANFFDDGLSVGISTYSSLLDAKSDNGTYIIENWEVVGRQNAPNYEQDVHSLRDMLHLINEKQPMAVRFSPKTIDNYCDRLKQQQQSKTQEQDENTGISY